MHWLRNRKERVSVKNDRPAAETVSEHNHAVTHNHGTAVRIHCSLPSPERAAGTRHTTHDIVMA
eukprot:SAG22_NODE_11582_length_478_cov_0.849604_1_plen_63_part_01